jgi:hypothetical protein
MAYGDDRSALVTDTFDSAISGDYTNGPNAWGVCEWRTGGYVGSTGGGDGDRAMYWSASTPDADQYARIQFGSVGGYCGPVVRMQSANEACYVAFNVPGSTGIDLYEYSSGLGSSYLTGDSTATVVGDWITLEAEGSTLRVGSNTSGTDTQSYTHTDTTLSSGFFGVTTYSTGLDNIDAFEGGEIGAAPPSGATTPQGLQSIGRGFNPQRSTRLGGELES